MTRNYKQVNLDNKSCLETVSTENGIKRIIRTIEYWKQNTVGNCPHPSSVWSINENIRVLMRPIVMADLRAHRW